MVGRLAIGGAAAIALATLLFPAQSSAKGFLGAHTHHAVLARLHFNGHRHSHRGHGDRNGAYAGGYGYWPLGYGGGDSAPEPGIVPLAYPIYVGPRCVHSVETVIVPAELGGERAVRITRC